MLPFPFSWRLSMTELFGWNQHLSIGRAAALFLRPGVCPVCRPAFPLPLRGVRLFSSARWSAGCCALSIMQAPSFLIKPLWAPGRLAGLLSFERRPGAVPGLRLCLGV
jgi:hypothetical protein